MLLNNHFQAYKFCIEIYEVVKHYVKYRNIDYLNINDYFELILDPDNHKWFVHPGSIGREHLHCTISDDKSMGKLYK